MTTARQITEVTQCRESPVKKLTRHEAMTGSGERTKDKSIKWRFEENKTRTVWLIEYRRSEEK